jgi:membrane-associated protease RseP (regulator of RpoE activity)
VNEVDSEETVKIHRLNSAVTVAILALTVVSSSLGAQERRQRSRDLEGPRTFTVYSEAMQDYSDRARIGVYVDRHQPTRYDERGARLKGIARHSPAQEAGLEEGDIITLINGQSLTSRLDDEIEAEFDGNASLPAQRLMAIARGLEPGDELKIEYLRNGEAESVSVEAEAGPVGLMRAPDAPALAFGWSSEGGDGRPRVASQLLDGGLWSGLRMMEQCPSGAVPWIGDEAGCLLGAEIREIGTDLGAYFDVDDGLLVTDVAEENPLGLRAGDVIVEVGGRDISSFRRLRRLITSYEADETITLTVMRSGREIQLEGTLD